MIEFIVFDIFCWFGLCALAVFFIYQKRKKTWLLRTFVRMAKNQSPEKWTATENAGGLPRQYSTTISGFCVVIVKYPSIPSSYRMFVSKENRAYSIFNGRKVEKTYNQIDQERRRTERIIEKWRRPNAKTEKKEALVRA